MFLITLVENYVVRAGAVALALIAILTLGGLGYKYVWAPIRIEYVRLKEVLESYLGKPATTYMPAVPGLKDTVENINKQVFPNGGESLADKVNDISERAIAVAMENNKKLRTLEDKLVEVTDELAEQREDRIRVVRASAGLRKQWADVLGVDIPEPDELKRWDDKIITEAEEKQSKGKHAPQ